ncbi:2Fe-2S iron-sulfur cluster binding domain-containing protein [Oceanicola sp. D3]|uniref:2Fe-2S iron-sulfur cluster-binding protein n=1 Tax=Oceanicola sp. D3 TaxID=2587163 RepID=UPI00111E5AE5|nr:2Fe-2S iron-sulfur cluster-binding protein [Oceanicola sp. D3]QDC10039.1 2Fe-2S iron-sulfur cluster binding domain-containing protein [Oceanicola sp. D3]
MSEKITLIFELPDGAQKQVEATVGHSVMQAAVLANVPHVEAECGGSLSCATCHVRAGDLPGGPSDSEDAMLDMTEAERSDDSRLSCQITVSPEMDGHVFQVPQPM